MTTDAPVPRVSVLVVSYNTREMTLACLRSLREQTSVPYELLVVDNASTDGSAEAIAEEFPDARLYAEHDNHGFAKANNIAAAQATGHYLLLLNPDTVVLDHAVDRLVDFADRTPGARIWGGRTLFGDHSLNPSSCWRRMSIWHAFCRTASLDTTFPSNPVLNAEAYGGWARDSEREVDIVSGCFFLIERDLWNRLGGFDLAFVMYGEEADLCLRARQHGARPRITPDAEIIHYGGASETVRSQKLVRLLNAKIELGRRHLPVWQRIPTTMLLRLWPLSRIVVLSLISRIRPKDATTRDALASWRDVWAQRQRWWYGYGGRTDAPGPETTARQS